MLFDKRPLKLLLIILFLFSTTLSSQTNPIFDQGEDTKLSIEDIGTILSIVRSTLKGKGVNCEIVKKKRPTKTSYEIIPVLIISIDGDHYLNKLARSMSELGVELSLDPHFTMEKFGRAAFSWNEANRTNTNIILSHAFIESLGANDKIALKHETRHFLIHILRALGHDSLFIGEINDRKENKGVREAYGGSFHIDEIPIHAEDIYSQAKKISTDLSKLYLGFHPEVKQIITMLRKLSRSASNNNVEAKLINFIYAYSNNTKDKEVMAEKLNTLLENSYDLSSQDIEDISKKALALANRDLVSEASEYLMKPGASHYDQTSFATNFKDQILTPITSMFKSVSVTSKLVNRAIHTIELVNDLRNYPAFYAAELESWCYSKNQKPSYLNHENNYSSLSRNRVHTFNAFTEDNTGVMVRYITTIATDDQDAVPQDLFFNRTTEQLHILEQYKEGLKKIEIIDSEYRELFSTDNEKRAYIRMNASLLELIRSKMLEITKISSDIREIKNSSVPDGLDVKERIISWKAYISGQRDLIKPKEIIRGSNNTNLNKSTYIQKTETYLSISDQEREALFKKIYEQDLQLKEEDLDLLFGEKDEAGERKGGVFNYWHQNLDKGDNWMYIALTGSLAYDTEGANERTILNFIYKAYVDAGLVNRPADLMIKDLNEKGLLTEKSTEVVLRNMVRIKDMAPTTKEVKIR